MNEAKALIKEAFAAFQEDVSAIPPMTLRAGNAADNYMESSPFSADEDAITEDYLHKYRWGLGYLDTKSWRHYMPHLIEHSINHYVSGSDVTDALLQNLRPPDRGGFSALNPDQEQVIVKLLDLIAFAEASPHISAAQTALEEWWGPASLYRPTST